MTARTARVRACPDCGAKILTGYDADVMGIPVTLDHDPVDNLGEALAKLQGRLTFDVRPTTGYRNHGRVLDERNAWRISHPRARPWPVHAEHRCGQPLPAAAVAPETAEPVTQPVDHTAPF